MLDAVAGAGNLLLQIEVSPLARMQIFGFHSGFAFGLKLLRGLSTNECARKRNTVSLRFEEPFQTEFQPVGQGHLGDCRLKQNLIWGHVQSGNDAFAPCVISRRCIKQSIVSHIGGTTRMQGLPASKLLQPATTSCIRCLFLLVLSRLSSLPSCSVRLTDNCPLCIAKCPGR